MTDGNTKWSQRESGTSRAGLRTGSPLLLLPITSLKTLHHFERNSSCNCNAERRCHWCCRLRPPNLARSCRVDRHKGSIQRLPAYCCKNVRATARPMRGAGRLAAEGVIVGGALEYGVIGRGAIAKCAGANTWLCQLLIACEDGDFCTSKSQQEQRRYFFTSPSGGNIWEI